MSGARMGLIFDGFETLSAEIDRTTDGLKEAVTDALEETQDIVRQEVEAAASAYTAGSHGSARAKTGASKGSSPYERTGDMQAAIVRDKPVEWTGTVARIPVGFTSDYGFTLAGFMHSIFLMRGTARMNKDPKLYNAVYGTRVKRLIADAQEAKMREHLKLGGGHG